MPIPSGPLSPALMFGFEIPRAVLGFMAVHRALRAETVAIERLARAGATTLARRRARLLARVLGHHHQAEDELLWPALLERDPALADLVARLEDDHVELDDLLARLPDDLSLAPQVRARLEAHLLAEEQLALPVWLSAFTPAEHERFAAALRRHTPWRDTGLMLSWLLDHTPEFTERHAADHVPAPVLLAHRVWLRRLYKWRWGTHSTEPRVVELAAA